MILLILSVSLVRLTHQKRVVETHTMICDKDSRKEKFQPKELPMITFTMLESNVFQMELHKD